MYVKDRLSGLPDFILHHILSSLPRKHAFRMSVLSKRWRFVVDTYPYLDIHWRDFGENINLTGLEPEDLTKEKNPEFWTTLEKLIHCVRQSISRFSKHGFCLQRFELFIFLPDMELASVLDEWLRVATENGVKEVNLFVHTPGIFPNAAHYALPKTFFAATSLTLLTLYGCELEVEESFCVKLHSLKKLLLADVHICDHMFKKLVACCPLIEEISLMECWGLKNLQICGFLRLKNFRIMSNMCGAERIEIVSPSLEISRFTFENGKPIIKVDACQGLKSLVIIGSVITEDFFQHLDLKFPILEKLVVSNCLTLKTVKISSVNLEHLRISCCDNIVEMEIDTPALLTCDYYGFAVPFSLINAPSCKWQVEVYLKGTINILWYMKLKDFLAKLNQLGYLHIYFTGTQIFLNLEGWHNITSPSTIDNLALTVHPTTSKYNYAAFMDGLFWCYRPKNLFIRSGSQSRYVKYFFKLPKRDPSHCSHGNIKCWQHDLKEVKFESLGEQPERMPPFNTMVLFRFPPERSHAHCKMEWQF